MVWPSSAGPLRCSRIVPTLGSSIGRRPASATVCERYPPQFGLQVAAHVLSLGRLGTAERPCGGTRTRHAGGAPTGARIGFARVLDHPVARAQLDREVALGV